MPDETRKRRRPLTIPLVGFGLALTNMITAERATSYLLAVVFLVFFAWHISERFMDA